MKKVYFNDETGDLKLISSHETEQEAEMRAETLDRVLDALLRSGRDLPDGTTSEQYRAHYRSSPHWALLCMEVPTVFTTDADPFALGFNMWPTIDVDE